MKSDFTPIIEAAARENTVIDSFVASYKALATQLVEAKNDPAEVQAIADAMDAKAGEIGTLLEAPAA